VYVDVVFGRYARMHGPESRDGMGSVSNAELAAKSGRGQASMMIGNVRGFPV
jgi:hypothetical protein